MDLKLHCNSFIPNNKLVKYSDIKNQWNESLKKLRKLTVGSSIYVGRSSVSQQSVCSGRAFVLSLKMQISLQNTTPSTGADLGTYKRGGTIFHETKMSKTHPLEPWSTLTESLCQYFITRRDFRNECETFRMFVERVLAWYNSDMPTYLYTKNTNKRNIKVFFSLRSNIWKNNVNNHVFIQKIK